MPSPACEQEKARFTPGPWHVGTPVAGRRFTKDDIEIQCRLKSMVCSLYAENFSMDGSRDRANANLIAAAPDLYEALKEYVAWHGAAHDIECPEDDTCSCLGKALNDKVNNAIQKAEGSHA